MISNIERRNLDIILHPIKRGQSLKARRENNTLFGLSLADWSQRAGRVWDLYIPFLCMPQNLVFHYSNGRPKLTQVLTSCRDICLVLHAISPSLGRTDCVTSQNNVCVRVGWYPQIYRNLLIYYLPFVGLDLALPHFYQLEKFSYQKIISLTLSEN